MGGSPDTTIHTHRFRRLRFQADFISELVDIHAEQIQNFSTPGASAEEDLDEQLARFSGSNRSGDNLSLSSATDNLILSSATGNLSLSSATFGSCLSPLIWRPLPSINLATFAEHANSLHLLNVQSRCIR